MRKMTKSGGGPIPGSQKIIQVAWLSSSTTDAIIFRPNEGELYRIIAADVVTTDGVGTVNVELKNASNKTCLVSTASANDSQKLIVLTNAPYVSYENYLWGDVTANAGTITITISAIQIG